MRTLLIMRHAQAAPLSGAGRDIDRPLSALGLRAAPGVGRRLAREELRPEVVVASPARRAVETAELVALAAGLELDILLEERIYEASPGELVSVVNDLPPIAARALIVGHNPGFAGLVQSLTGDCVEMPTGALASVEFDFESWRDVEASAGRLLAVWTLSDSPGG